MRSQLQLILFSNCLSILSLFGNLNRTQNKEKWKLLPEKKSDLNGRNVGPEKTGLIWSKSERKIPEQPGNSGNNGFWNFFWITTDTHRRKQPVRRKQLFRRHRHRRRQQHRRRRRWPSSNKQVHFERVVLVAEGWEKLGLRLYVSQLKVMMGDKNSGTFGDLKNHSFLGVV